MASDMNGSELRVGDVVCFIVNERRGWRQSPTMASKRIAGIKSGLLILEDYDHKVSSHRVIKVK